MMQQQYDPAEAGAKGLSAIQIWRVLAASSKWKIVLCSLASTGCKLRVSVSKKGRDAGNSFERVVARQFRGSCYCYTHGSEASRGSATLRGRWWLRQQQLWHTVQSGQVSNPTVRPIRGCLLKTKGHNFFMVAIKFRYGMIKKMPLLHSHDSLPWWVKGDSTAAYSGPE
jgi:hypothetical protein